MTGWLRQAVRPKWLGLLLVALLVSGVFFRLGLWQWHRHEGKVDAVERIEQHRDAPPVPYQELVRPDGSYEYTDEWSQTEVRGRYLPEHQTLVRNRPHFGHSSKSTYGYEVLVPFEPVDGPTIVVNRGWVANGPDARTLPEIPPAPEGEVTLKAWLRPPEPARDRDLPEGQVDMVSTSEVEDSTGVELAEPFLLMREDGASERPEPLDPPDTDLGPHQAYAYQWWLGMLFPVGLWIFAVRADALAALPEGERRRRREEKARAKAQKVRIWDEEDA
ncbi:SURF1 family cytochrome oxidase biogenesis protein [Kytococcus sp. Marseille-QA3725]